MPQPSAPADDVAAKPTALTLETAAALAITAVAGFLFLNGSLFSTLSSLHIDYSINWVAAHALLHRQDPYGITTLAVRAKSLGAPTGLVYGQLFTSYIQPPTSALTVTPLTVLPWREATRAWLLLNHVMLAAAVYLTLVTLRPTLPKHWLAAGVALLLLLYSQLYASFALGQVDAMQVMLLSLGFWAYARGRNAIAGGAIAYAAAIKLIPGLLLVYFLWRREYRIVAWGLGVGAALFLLSLAAAGWGTYHTYLATTLPALSKGSTHYSNAGFGALIARAHTPSFYRGLPEMIYLDEVASNTAARLASIAVTLAGLAVIVSLVPGRRAAGEQRQPKRLVWEYYFVVAVGLIVSSVTWEFYVVWLLPVFIAALVCCRDVLPAGRERWWLLAGFALALVLLNYPGDFYLFSPNAIFYHPSLVPGVFVEKYVRLYHNHLDWVVYLRLSGLLLLASLLAWLARRQAPAEAEAAIQ